MDMELAQLFASLGFKYDRAALQQFNKDLRDAAKSASGLSLKIDSDFQHTNTEVKRSSTSVDSFVKRVRSSYSKVRPSLDQMRKDLEKINGTLENSKLRSGVRAQYEDLQKRVSQSIDRETAKREKATLKESRRVEREAEKRVAVNRKLAQEKERLDRRSTLDRQREQDRAERKARIEQRFEQQQADRQARIDRRLQQDKLLSERRAARERKKTLESEAAERRRMMKQRLNDVVRERRRERQLLTQQHKETLRNQRKENAEALRGKKDLNRKLSTFGMLAGGLGGIYSLRESMKEYQSYQGSLAGLSAATGSSEKAEEDFSWLRQLSDRLGVFMGDVTKGYTSLAANTRSAGVDDTSTKKMFESILSYSRTLNLGKGDVDGVLRGLSQMVGKGKLQSEEVRQQVGERLPGFIPAAAKSLGFGEGEEGTSKFYKELEAGNLTAKKLFSVLPDELMRMANAGDALEKAMNTTSAAIGRLQTNVWMANKTFNESGFDKSVRGVTNRLSESVIKMEGMWKILGKVSSYLGDALETPIEIIGTLSQTFAEITGDGENFSLSFQRMCAALVIAVAPLRKAFAMFYVLPAGLSALNDLIEHWKTGDLGQKGWKELATEIGLATAAIGILVGMASKVVRLTSAIKGFGGALASVKRNPAIAETASDLGRASTRGSAGGSGKGSKKRRGGKIAAAGGVAGATYLAADSMMPELSEENQGGLLDYARGAGSGAATGAFAGSAAGPWGSLVGAGVGATLGLADPYKRSLDRISEAFENNAGNLYNTIAKSYSVGSAAFQKAGVSSVSDVAGVAGRGLSSLANATDALKNPTQDNLQGILQQLGVNPQVPQNIQNIQTQNTIGSKVDNMEVNITINGNDEVNMRETLDDVLKGHFRSAMSSRPRVEG